MTSVIYSNCIGTFVFKDKKIAEEKLFSNEETLKYSPQLEKNQEIEPETAFLKKHPGAEIIGKSRKGDKGIGSSHLLPPQWILEHFSNNKYIPKMKQAMTVVTKRKVAESVKPDYLIAQAVNNVDEIDKVANNLSKRLREWYELYNPEFSKSVESHEKFAELIQTKTKTELLKEVGLVASESMGSDFDENQLHPVLLLAEEISALFALREKHVAYIEKSMQEQMPNITAVAGGMIGAKLLAIAGSLEKMALFPASTIQLLGAEKALFRHIKTGARPPKFGVIINHPLVTQAKPAVKGRAARVLADKISIASKVDFFKGEFCGDELRKDLELKLRV